MISAEVKPKGSSQSQVPPETVLFAPHTPGGELKKALQDIEPNRIFRQPGSMEIRSLQKVTMLALQNQGRVMQET